MQLSVITHSRCLGNLEFYWALLSIFLSQVDWGIPQSAAGRPSDERNCCNQKIFLEHFKLLIARTHEQPLCRPKPPVFPGSALQFAEAEFHTVRRPHAVSLGQKFASGLKVRSENRYVCILLTSRGNSRFVPWGNRSCFLGIFVLRLHALARLISSFVVLFCFFFFFTPPLLSFLHLSLSKRSSDSTYSGR